MGRRIVSYVVGGLESAIVVADKKGNREVIPIKTIVRESNLRNELNKSDWGCVCREFGYQSGYREGLRVGQARGYICPKCLSTLPVP